MITILVSISLTAHIAHHMHLVSMVTHHMHWKERVHGAVAFTALPQVNDTISCTCLHRAGDGWRRGQEGRGRGRVQGEREG